MPARFGRGISTTIRVDKRIGFGAILEEFYLVQHGKEVAVWSEKDVTPEFSEDAEGAFVILHDRWILFVADQPVTGY